MKEDDKSSDSSSHEALLRSPFESSSLAKVPSTSPAPSDSPSDQQRATDDEQLFAFCKHCKGRLTDGVCDDGCPASSSAVAAAPSKRKRHSAEKARENIDASEGRIF